MTIKIKPLILTLYFLAGIFIDAESQINLSNIYSNTNYDFPKLSINKLHNSDNNHLGFDLEYLLNNINEFKDELNFIYLLSNSPIINTYTVPTQDKINQIHLNVKRLQYKMFIHLFRYVYNAESQLNNLNLPSSIVGLDFDLRIPQQDVEDLAFYLKMSGDHYLQALTSTCK